MRFVRNALAFFTPEVGDYLVNAISFFSFSFLLNHEIFILSCLAKKLVWSLCTAFCNLIFFLPPISKISLPYNHRIMPFSWFNGIIIQQTEFSYACCAAPVIKVNLNMCSSRSVVRLLGPHLPTASVPSPLPHSYPSPFLFPPLHCSEAVGAPERVSESSKLSENSRVCSPGFQGSPRLWGKEMKRKRIVLNSQWLLEIRNILNDFRLLANLRTSLADC